MQHPLGRFEIGHSYQLKRVLAVSSAKLASLFIPQNINQVGRVSAITVLYDGDGGMCYSAPERAAEQD
jgi:hypothetical protein